MALVFMKVDYTHGFQLKILLSYRNIQQVQFMKQKKSFELELGERYQNYF